MGRKRVLEIGLNSHGQIHIRIGIIVETTGPIPIKFHCIFNCS